MEATTGREFFDSLNRNADGRVSLDDLKAAMRQRNLPERYAQDFVRSARGGRWWSQSITCALFFNNPQHVASGLPSSPQQMRTSPFSGKPSC